MKLKEVKTISTNPIISRKEITMYRRVLSFAEQRLLGNWIRKYTDVLAYWSCI